MPTEFAPAKINLTLHVTGQRADGYHLLDSLVVFAETGDRIHAGPGPLALRLEGPMAGNLTAGTDNLVLRAARLIGVEASLVLEKHLPVSSGIGGGSSDAAATLRLLSRLSGKAVPDRATVLSLGADVPVCLEPRAVRLSGIGEHLQPVAALPEAWLVLVNPGVALATPDVFRGLSRRDHPPMPAGLPHPETVADLAAFLRMMRNDLEAPALALAPEIGGVKAALQAQAGCLLARMSGSGATCFGLFADGLSAETAARTLRERQAHWWVTAARMIS